MTNEELKKKIINLLDEATGSWYEDEDGMFAEGYSAEEGDNRFKAHVADALIAAGIGFMDDDITFKIVATIKRDTEPITMENVALRKQVAEAEHRAQVAEKKYKLLFQKYDSFFNGVTYCHKNFSDVDREITEQAERELAEEKKDD